MPNLTPGQWGSIRQILSHPDTTPDIIHKTRKVIYTHYESWALHRAQVFRETRRGLCRHISRDELAIYASRGLIRAIERCNFDDLGKTPFSVYASKWVEYELLDGMTELQPMTTLVKRFRKKSGIYNRRYFRIHSLDNREYAFKKTKCYDHDHDYDYKTYDDAWEKVDTVLNTPFAKRAFVWKYSETLDQVRSNAVVGELMGCSEETIRTELRVSKTNKYE